MQPNHTMQRMRASRYASAALVAQWRLAPAADSERWANMERPLISTLIALFVTSMVALAQPRIDPALVAAARKALPADISTNDVAKALSAGLWNSNRTAVAISINRVPRPSIIFVFLKQSSGQYRAGDVSGVEGGNFGVLGIAGRAGYERFETTPIEWLPRDDGRLQVVMRTRAWKAGRRYTVSEKLVVSADGTPLYR
jgi:hypothetical protein